ncbi:MAG TPA: exonuclease domain-containing protein [Usitatibacteraceae bacterium]|nr:exonuclease domain-containing protein [Usitatibacteraceae bacterium]
MTILAPAVAFVDLETTGTSATGDRVTEVAIVRVVEGEVVEEWCTLVDPERSIPPDIQVLTGITNEMVKGAPTFADIRHEVRERLEGYLFVAHNARFDYGFLKNEFARLEMPFTADVLCTVRLSRRLYPEAVGHSLDALIARHGLADPLDCADPAARTGRHSALGDARALRRFTQVIEREKSGDEIAAAVKRLLKIPSLPPQLPPDALDGIPEGPGVYRFFGVNDLPLYIGKSVNLRDRVRSHFTSDYRNSNDHRLSAEIRRLDWLETAGELGALLLESRLVKEVAPLHNALLRRRRTSCVLRLPSLREAPEFLDLDEIDWDARGPGAESLYGPFSSPRAARDLLEAIASEEGLCWRLLGWEKRGGPCFARQVKKCRGACVGEESPEAHNVRLATALEVKRIPDWPFAGPVAIVERDPARGIEEAHVIRQWRHLGTARDEDELASLAAMRRLPAFDPDILRVLVRWLAEHPGKARLLDGEPDRDIAEYADGSC